MLKRHLNGVYSALDKRTYLRPATLSKNAKESSIENYLQGP
ncbi:hypothetical protein ALQ82_200242 [Pseudomonas syringae pv. pisi]|nr:hypothetical protein ALQ82_200242 [Pseudomonas syringae pv. pisi]